MNAYALLPVKRLTPIALGLAAAIAMMESGVAQATTTPYVVALTQQGNNVVANGSGEFDLAGLTFEGSTTFGGAGIGGAHGVTSLGAPTGAAIDAYSGFTGPSSFGSGSSVRASAASGNITELWDSLGMFWVPHGYVSGTDLSGNFVFDNSTFARLGVTPGSYTWTWGSGADQSFTLDVVTAVPEPADLGMFGLGLAVVGGFAALRRRQARNA